MFAFRKIRQYGILMANGGAISIDTKELIRCRLGGQHLLTQRASNAEIAADLCGAQAQILRNALFTLQSRTAAAIFPVC